jgi:hypothetical protein
MARVLSPVVGVKGGHEGDGGLGIQLFQCCFVSGEKTHEGVLRERDAKPLTNRLSSHALMLPMRLSMKRWHDGVMKLYSDYAGHRSRQILFDVVALAAMAAWAWLGYTLYSLVMQLAEFGVQMQESGAGFKTTMTDVSDTLSGIWLIGDGIKAPFDAASDAGATLESAGIAQQDAVHQLALGLGIGIAVLPIVTILIFWLVPRVRFAVRAGTAKALLSSPASVDLLALRALSKQKIGAIGAIDPDAAGAWRRGDPEIVRKLAALELKSSGVRLPA